MPTPFDIFLSDDTPWSGRLVGRLVWDDAAQISARRMAFQYDSDWCRTGFALGADLPLTDKIQYLPQVFGKASQGIAPYSRQQSFGFVSDWAPGAWLADLLHAARLNRLDWVPSQSLCTPSRLWAGSGNEKDRFSSFKLPITHSFQTKHDIDYFEKKRFGQLVNALQRLQTRPETLNKAQLEDLRNTVVNLGGQSVKALVVGRLDGDQEAAWVVRASPMRVDFNVARWQAIGMGLAQWCGLSIIKNAFLDSTLGGAYLEKRFDRTDQGRSLLCVSAATLIKTTLMPGRPPRAATYADIADVLNREGASPKKDLAELFSRLLFNTLTGNRHDHLSDFWFYRSALGWRLAPFNGVSIQPPDQKIRLMNTPIIGNDNSADPELSLSVSRYFGLSLSEAKEKKLAMQQALMNWNKLAKSMKATKSEIDLAAGSFSTDVA